MSATPVPDSEFTLAMVQAWAGKFSWTDNQAGADLGLGIVSGVVSVVDTDDQSKRNRNRAKAILDLGG